MLENLKDKIKKSKSIIFTKFDGLGVKENEELRNKLRAENSEYLVTKKTLLDLAFKDNKIDNLDVKKFNGQIAAVFGFEDEVAPAKIVDEFKDELSKAGKEPADKAGEKIDFICGILEGKYLDANEVGALAKLPSKQELYAKIVGSINAPVSGLVNALAGNMRNLVYVLNNIKDNK